MFTQHFPFNRQQFWLHLLFVAAILGSSLAWAPPALAAGHPSPVGPDKPEPAATPAAPSSPEANLDKVCSQANQPESPSAPCWNWWWSHYHPDFDAWIYNNILYVQGTHFGRHRDIQVNARRNNSGWYRFGSTRVTRTGTIGAGYKLPSNLRHTSRLYVCLRDLKDRKSYCEWAYRVD